MKSSPRFLQQLVLSILALIPAVLHAGNLKVIITPTSVASDGAQWRVDGGIWRNSGTTVKSLANTAHSVEFKPMSGWVAPTPLTVTLSGNTTTSLTAEYIATASLSMSLSPAGQWRVDGRPWQNSGTYATDLAPANHTVEFGPVPGYTTPAPEVVALIAGQSVVLNRTYTQQAYFAVVLYPSAARWRVNGGAWQPSGASTHLNAGTYTIEYLHVVDYLDPAPETVTLSAGQYLTWTRSYTYAPATVSMTLSGENGAGRWRIDGGTWTPTNYSVPVPSGVHTIEYMEVPGYTAPATETVTLAERQLIRLARSYVSERATFSVALTPQTGRWRVNGGAWLVGGAKTLLDAGTYSVEYLDLVDYREPVAESITLSARQYLIVTRSYTYTPATISMTLSGENGLGRWRIDGGTWRPGNYSVPVPSGAHTVEYLEISGYTAPPTETVTLAEQQFFRLTRSYVALPASLSLTLTPQTAHWRVEGGAWQPSGAVVTVTAGPRTVEYEHLNFHIQPESEVVNVAGPTNISRTYIAGAGDVLVNSNPPLLGKRGVAQWRVNGGPWRPCGSTRGLAPGTYTLEFRQMNGLDTPPPMPVTVTAEELLELEADFFMPHRLRFFIKDDLAAGLTVSELQARLSQYAADLQTIFHRETARRFIFNPSTDITVCTADPFSWNYIGNDMPELGFEMWIYARLTDNPAYGTYGGNGGLDLSGAGGAANLKWDRVYDPATLQADTPELEQYWKQIDHITHEFQHSFGAGLGEYYSLLTLPDPTGIEPILPQVSFSFPAPSDPFWGTRQEYWTDTLLLDIYGQPRAGSPRSMPALLEALRFAPATKGVINSLCRRNGKLDSLPDLSRVKVRVVDATSGLAIPDATCRAWNRRVDGTYNTFEQDVVATETPGEFQFAWTPYPVFNPMGDRDNAKIVKAWAPGYIPAAQWESVYDAQKARTWDLKDIFEITIALSRE